MLGSEQIGNPALDLISDGAYLDGLPFGSGDGDIKWLNNGSDLGLSRPDSTLRGLG